ncbi:MAG: hypothetical protein ACXAAH_09860, partial [Promethearchaeota archaeon]
MSDIFGINGSGTNINGESGSEADRKTIYMDVFTPPDTTNFSGVLTVNGLPVGGGNPFDQNLNTTDNVQFASVSTPLITNLQSLTIDNQLVLKDGVAGNELALTAPASGIHTIQTFQSGAPANDLTITSNNVRMEVNGNYTEQVTGSSIENIGINKTLQVVGNNSMTASLHQISGQTEFSNDVIVKDATTNNNITFNAPTTGLHSITTNQGTAAANDLTITSNNVIMDANLNYTEDVSANKIENIGANKTIQIGANKIENIAAANQQTIIGTNTITAASHQINGNTVVGGTFQVGVGPGYLINDAGGQGATTISAPSDVNFSSGGNYDMRFEQTNGNPGTRNTQIDMTVQTAGNLPIIPSFSISGLDSQIVSRLPFRVDNEINAKHIKISTVNTLGDPNVIESVEGDQVTDAPIEIKGRDLKFTTTAVNSQLDLDGEIIKIGTGAGNVINPPSQVAIGVLAGDKGLDRSICIGEGSGNLSAGEDSVAIGSAANTALGGVAIGGSASSAVDSLALGYRARTLVNNSIVLNGSGNFLDSANSGFYVKPIRSEFLNPNVCYDAGTGELVYNEKRALLLPDTDLTGITRNDLSGILYKKSGDDGLWWAPDSTGTEIDLTQGGGSPNQALIWAISGVLNDYNTTTSQAIVPINALVDGSLSINYPGAFLLNEYNAVIRSGLVINVPSTGWYSIRFFYTHTPLPIIGTNTQAGLGSDCKVYIRINGGANFIPLGQDDSGAGANESSCCILDKFCTGGSTIQFYWEFGTAQTNEDFFISAALVNTQYSNPTEPIMSPATDITSGVQGLVPVPPAGSQLGLLTGGAIYTTPDDYETLFGIHGTILKQWSVPVNPTTAGLILNTAQYNTAPQNNYFIQLTNGGSQSSSVVIDTVQNYSNFRLEAWVKILNTTDPADILALFGSGNTSNPTSELLTGGLSTYIDFFNSNTHNFRIGMNDGLTNIIPYQPLGVNPVNENYFKITLTRY